MKFVFVLGATGTGKSKFSVSEALKKDACIINCDSLQVYQGTEIGSAQPSLEDKKRVPHYLYSFKKLGVSFTVGDYLRSVENLLKEIKHPICFFVGGSGFFSQALEKGLWPAPKTSEEQSEKIRKRAQKEGLAVLHEELSLQDPVYAQKIQPQDSYRIQRALCIMESENKTLTEIKKEFSKKEFSILDGDIFKLAFSISDKEEYRKRLKKRVEKMLEEGLLQETEKILHDVQDPHWSALKAVGYKQVIEFLNNELKEEDLVDSIVQHTLKLSKKQKTWFQKDPQINWFESSEKASKFLSEKLT